MTEKEFVKLKEQLKVQNRIDEKNRAQEPKLSVFEVRGKESAIKEVLKMDGVILVLRDRMGVARISVPRNRITEIKERVPNVSLTLIK